MFLSKKKAVYQAIANFGMWLFVPVVIGAITLIKGADLATPFPKQELFKLVEPAQLGIFLTAGVFYFLGFAIFRHKSKKEKDQANAVFYANLGFDEMATALYSFGSILFVCLLVGAQWWYLFPAFACYLVGYWLKPDDEPLHEASPFEYKFSESDWQPSKDNFSLLIPHSIHNKGAGATATIFEQDPNGWEEVGCEIRVQNDGSILIGVSKPIIGKVVIK